MAIVPAASLPEECLLRVLAHLSHEERARAGAVCKSWSAATRNPTLWKGLEVRLKCLKSPGHLLKWLLCRKEQLEALALRDLSTGAWSDTCSLLACVGPTLRELDLASRGALRIGAWTVPMVQLHRLKASVDELIVRREAGIKRTDSKLVLNSVCWRGVQGLDMRNWAFPGLRVLDLHARRIYLPELGVATDTVYLQSSSLRSLRLSDCNLKSLFNYDPEDSDDSDSGSDNSEDGAVVEAGRRRTPILGDLPQLRELYLSGNYSLRHFRVGFSALPQLQKLSMSGCDLSRLPAELSKLTSLRILDVSYNDRFYAGRDAGPETLQALSSLVVLNCSGCELEESYPGNLLSMPSLRVLLLHDMYPMHTSAYFVQMALAASASITRVVWLSLSLEVALQGLPLLKTVANLRRLDVSVPSNLASDTGMKRLEGLGDTLLGLPRFREFCVVPTHIPNAEFDPEAPFCLPDKLVELMLRLTRSGRVAASALNIEDHSGLISRTRFVACNFDVESLWP